jgi:Flp pilus assembly protein TadG
MRVQFILQKLVRLAREENASTLIEFAMTALALMALMLGVIACAFALYVFHFTAYAADQGASFAQLRGNTWSAGASYPCGTSAPPSFTMKYDCTATAGDVQNYVQSLASGGINTSNLTVTTNWPGTDEDGSSTNCGTKTAQGCMVQVTVSYNLDFPLPNLSLLQKLRSLTLTGTSQKVIVQ